MFRNQTDIVRNIHGQVADRIGLSIIRGEIAPGNALPSESQICEMLDVSRPVVREAIRILAGKGLLETRAKSGTRVRPTEKWNHLDPDVLRWRLSAEDVDIYLEKLFALRYSVEPAAAALAAVAASADDRIRLQAAMAGMENATTNDQFVAADLDFHKTIYIGSRNEFFWSIAQMFEIAARKSFDIAATGDHRARALAEHRAVLEAILARDSAGARSATLTLVTQALGDLERIRPHEGSLDGLIERVE
jgi:DNA-binding FadR family transcriptional regulator